MRGKKPTWDVKPPDMLFSLLAEDQMDLETVKRFYLRALYYRNRSVIKTARVAGIDRSTVAKYLGS